MPQKFNIFAAFFMHGGLRHQATEGGRYGRLHHFVIDASLVRRHTALCAPWKREAKMAT
jgi:hypothetical protein